MEKKEIDKQERIMVQVSEGCNEIVIRHGEAPKQLPEQEPINVSITGTIGAVRAYIEQRKEQFDHMQAHILVDREYVTITLVTNETDERKQAVIKGALQLHPKYVQFGINDASTVWTPEKLGLFAKMNRAYFASIDDNMQLVYTLMHFKANVDSNLSREMEQNGNRSDSYAQVVNSNLPDKFTLKVPIFKGQPAEEIEVETFASIDGRNVQFLLMSPGAAETFESVRDKEIDAELEAIKAIAGDIVIIEI